MGKLRCRFAKRVILIVSAWPTLLVNAIILYASLTRPAATVNDICKSTMPELPFALEMRQGGLEKIVSGGPR